MQQTEQAQAWLDGAASLCEKSVRVSDWSPAQHLHHVAVINQRIADQLLKGDHGAPGAAVKAQPRNSRICVRFWPGDGDGAPGAAAGRPNVAGYLVLLMGRLPRGRGRSPDAFRPPDTVDREALVRRIDGNRRLIDELADQLGTLRQSDWRSRHPVLGYFDASEWLRFARIHTAHHHRIIRDIMAENR